MNIPFPLTRVILRLCWVLMSLFWSVPWWAKSMVVVWLYVVY